MQNNILEKIVEIVNKEFDIKLENVLSSDTLISYGIDSIAFMTMIIYIEEEYSIEFSFDGIFMKEYSDVTFDDLMEEINNLINKAGEEI